MNREPPDDQSVSTFAHRGLTALAVALSFYACGDDVPGPSADAGPTAGRDAGPGPGPDSNQAADADLTSDADAAPGTDASVPLDATANEDGGGLPPWPLREGACAGPFECEEGQGCAAGQCGLCTAADDCLPGDVCRVDGSCGECSDSTECALGQNCQSGFCIDASLRAWNLEIAESDYFLLIDNPYEEIFVLCALVADGVRYDQGCQVRLRGGSARDYPKKSFRITFADGVPHPGFSRKINLRAEYNEPSFLRNVIALETFRRLAQVPTPRTRFIDFSINGVSYGLMSEVERVGGKLLRTNGRDDLAPLYEADPPRDLFALGTGSLVPLPDEATYQAGFDKKSPDDPSYADLMHFVENVIWADFVESTTRRLRTELDVELYLQYLALMGVVQNHDHIRKNYYLTRQLHPVGNQRWEMLPWDLDLSFGCLYDDVLMTTYCDEFIVDQAPDRGILVGAEAGYPVMAFYNQLQHDVLLDPQMRARFESLACGALDSEWWSSRLLDFIDAKEVEIRASVAADDRDRNADEFAFEAEVEDLRRFLTERAAVVRSVFSCP